MKLFQEFLMGQENKVEKEINVAGAVIVKNNNEDGQSILLIQRAKEDNWPSVWEYPRGKCDKGDENDLKSCLKREVKEETGLDIEIIKYIDKYEYIADHGKRKSTQFNFLCKLIDSNQKIKLSKEHQDYRWIMGMGEIELLVPSEMKKTISQVLNKDEKIVLYPKADEVIAETQERWIK